MQFASGTILGIDSSTGACSAALVAGSAVLAHRREEMSRGQSERLAPMVEAVMTEAGRGFESLDAVAVTRGPGSFTGVRIGMAMAKGLGQALRIPVLGITGFDAVAMAALNQAEGPLAMLAIVLESRREDLFVQLFGADGALLSDPEALPADAIAARLRGHFGALPILLAGDAADRVAACLGPDDVSHWRHSPVTVPDAREVALLARDGRRTVKGAELKPLYLRAPDVTLPRSA